MRYIAIDPGEGWCGVAILDTRDAAMLMRTCVLRARGRSFLELGRDLLAAMPADVVIAEDFQARPQGHQAFSRVQTARILGMLEYATTAAGSRWATVPPNDPDRGERLRKLVLGHFVEQWAAHWDASPNWQHARSAWRVLGEHLFKRSTSTLLALANQRVSIMPTFRLVKHGVGMERILAPRLQDLIAPPAQWQLLTPITTS